MKVELFGLPGSGKTTLAESFVAEGATLVRTPGRAGLVFENLLFVTCHPVRAVRLLFFIMKHAAPRYRTLALENLFLAANAKYMRAARASRRGKTALIDQGHFQALLSLFETAPEQGVMDRLARMLPRPDLLLILEVPQEERQRRIEARGRMPRAEFGSEAASAFAAAAEAAYPLALGALAEAGVPHETITGVSGAKLSGVFLKHISYVTAARMPTEKAHGVSIAHMCTEFAQLGSDVSLVVPERRNPISENIFKFYGVAKDFHIGMIATPDPVGHGYTNPLFFFLQRLLFLLKLKQIAFPPGIIYTREPEIAWLFSASHRAIFEAHRWPRGSAGRLQAWLIRDAALVVCNSRGTEEAAHQAGVIRTLVAPNGFDPAVFTRVKKKTRAELGFPDGVLALYAGSDNPGKGADIVRAAAKQALSEDVSIGIIGTGKKQISPPLYELGRALPAEVPGYLASADMLILPTTRENEESERFTSPIKLFEYLAAGKAIIASDVSSVREILSDGDAVFVPPGDPTALASAIAFLAADQAFRKKLSHRAKELSVSYTWHRRAQRILETLQS